MRTGLQRTALLLCAALFTFSVSAQNGGNNGNNGNNGGTGGNNGVGGGTGGGQQNNRGQGCILVRPADIAVNATPGTCGAAVNFPEVSTSGSCDPVTFSIASGSVFPVGTTLVTVTSGSQTTTFNVTVRDAQAPTFDCPAAIEANTDPGTCAATLSITAPRYSDNCSSGSAVGVRNDGLPLADPFPKGVTTITWTATDDAGNSSSCTQLVTVTDNEPPVLTAVSATPNTLWSPNHKMVDIELTYDATDNCPGLTYEVLDITSNEALNGTGDGNTEVDWEIVDGQHVKVRSERSGNGTGRIYTISAIVRDAAGNASEIKTVTVTVAHDQGNGARAAGNTLEVAVAPNPSASSFTFKVDSPKADGPINMVVSDVSGKVVYTRTGITAGQTITWGSELKPGIYYAELRQGEVATQRKVVKAGK